MKNFWIAIAVIGAGLLSFPTLSVAFSQDVTAEAPAAPVQAAPAPEAPAAPLVQTPDSPPAPPAPPAPPPAPVEPEADTLVGSSDIESGGYGGPGLKFGRIAGSNVVFVGGRGGWIINNSFVIGGFGYGMATQPKAPPATRTPFALSNALEERLSLGYGGLMMEYFILPKKIIHATVGLLVGGGGVSVNQHYRDGFDDNDRDRNRDMMDGPSDSFFIAEPELHVELNIVKFLRVDLGASYRIVTGVNGIGLENDDLRGPGGSLLLRFGKF